MKRIIPVILATLMIFAIIPFSANADSATKGDVNGDGKVNMFDYMLIKGIYFGSYEPSEEELARADINADGKVNMFDYAGIKQIYFSESNNTQPDDSDWDKTPRDIEYTAHGLSGSLKEYDIQGIRPEYGMELTSFLVTDFEQLNALLEIYLDYSNSAYSRVQFDDFAAELADDYFDTKALVVTPVYASTGTAQISIENVRMDENGITTEISVVQLGEGTSDCQNRLMTAEINKSDIGGCTLARAEIVKLDIYCTTNYFSGNVLFVEDCELPCRLYTDFEELNGLSGVDEPYGSDELTEYIESLPEDFFDTKILAITQVALPDGSYSAYVSTVVYGDQRLTIYIDRWSDQNGSYPDLFSYVFAVTEIDRADVGDVTSLDAKYLFE